MKKQIELPLQIGSLLFIGLIVAIGTDVLLTLHNEKIIRDRLGRLALDVSALVKERISTYEYGLRGARGLIIGASSEKVSRGQFHSYMQSRELDREFPGSRGFGYIVRVRPGREAELVDRARAEGLPGFGIKELNPNPGEKFVIRFIEPEEQNRAAIGLDIASEPLRREAAIMAMDSGQVSMTGPLTLVQAIGATKRGFLLLLPVFRDGTKPETVERRREMTIGWTYTPIVMDEVLGSLHSLKTGYDLSLYDIGPRTRGGDGSPSPSSIEKGSEPFFDSTGHDGASGPDRGTAGRLEKTVIMELYSRLWGVKVSARPDFIKGLNLQQPWFAAILIGGLTLLLAALLYFYIQSQARKRQIGREYERLALVVENSGDAIVGHTRSGLITSWNRSAEALFGHSSQEAVGQDFSRLAMPPDKLEEEGENLRAVVSGNTLNSFSTSCKTKGGSLVDVSMTMAPIRTASGNIIGVTRTIRNIGEAKSFEAKLIALNNSLDQQVRERTLALNRQKLDLELVNARLLQIIESAPYALVQVDAEGGIQIFNSQAEKIFGYAREEILGSNIELLVPGRHRSTHRDLVKDYLRHAIARPMGRGRDLFGLRKDGTEFPVEIGLSTVAAPRGLSVLAAVIDISQRKENELLIQQYSSFQQAILSYAGFAIIATKPDGLITLFNPAAEKMLGFDAAEMVGEQTPRKFHLADEIAARARQLSEELHTEVEVGFEAFIAKARVGFADEHEWTYVRKDGSRLPVLLKVSALFDAKGEIDGYLGIAVDLTERNEAARQLAVYSEHLSEMVEARTKELEAAQVKLLSQERVQQDLRLAAEIQDSLLPKTAPRTRRYDIAMFAKPARYVSGDVYDVVALDEDTVFVFLADISGKGIPAALMTSAARMLFKQGIHRSRSPLRIQGSIAEMLEGDLAKGELFMTCQICRLDYRNGSIVYSNAGHTETVVYRSRSGEFDGFVPTSLPIGIQAPAELSFPDEQAVLVRPGDLVIFYSDGLTEMTDVSGLQFGIARLRETLSRHRGEGAESTLDAILAEVQAFSGDKEAEDDTSIVVVRILPSTLDEEWRSPPSALDTIVSTLVSPCRGYGPTFAYEMELLASELFSNIYRHAYGIKDLNRDPPVGLDPFIRIHLELGVGGIVLDVEDHGREFSGPTGSADSLPGPDSLSEGGYGFAILKRLTDSIGYARVAESNHWHLVKNKKETAI